MADNFIPRHVNFGMTAEDIGGQQLACDAFLAGVDNLELLRDCGNLGTVTGCDGETQDNAHWIELVNEKRNERDAAAASSARGAVV